MGSFLGALCLSALKVFGVMFLPEWEICPGSILLLVAVLLIAAVGFARATGRGAALMSSPTQNWFLLFILVGLALLPMAGSRYVLELAIQVMIFGLFAMSFNVVSGHIGNISFRSCRASLPSAVMPAAIFRPSPDLPFALSSDRRRNPRDGCLARW